MYFMVASMNAAREAHRLGRLQSEDHHRKVCSVVKNLVFLYYDLTFRINSRYQIFLPKT